MPTSDSCSNRPRCSRMVLTLPTQTCELLFLGLCTWTSAQDEADGKFAALAAYPADPRTHLLGILGGARLRLFRPGNEVE